MSNALEFILKLTDMLTPAMRSAAGVSDGAASKIQGNFDRITGKSRTMNASLNEMKQRLDSINNVRFGTKLVSEFNMATREAQKLERQIDRLENKGRRGSGAGGGGMLGSIVGGNIITGLLSRGVGMAGGAVGDLFNSASGFGATQKSFEVLTRSPQKGKALSGELNQLQQETILGPSVFQNAQTMLGFGVSIEKVVPTMKMLGDVSMGNVDKLNALTYAYSQVTAAGRLQGQDLLQFINAGWNPLQQLVESKVFPNLMAAKTAMEKGAISSDLIAFALKQATGEGGKFNNMLNTIAETPAGKMAKLSGQWDSFKVSMGQALMPLYEIGLTALNKMLELGQMVIPWITSGVSQIMNLFGGINIQSEAWSFWFSLIQEKVATIWMTVKSLLSNVWNIVSGVIQWVGKSELMKDIAWLIGKAFDAVYWVVRKIGDSLEWIWDNILKPVLNALESVYRFTKNLLGFGGKAVIENKVTVGGKVTTVPAGSSSGITPTNITPGIVPGGALESGKSKSDSINNGGQRSIVINIGKQIEKLEISVLDAKEGANEIENMVREALRRVLYNINGIATA